MSAAEKAKKTRTKTKAAEAAAEAAAEETVLETVTETAAKEETAKKPAAKKKTAGLVTAFTDRTKMPDLTRIKRSAQNGLRKRHWARTIPC